MKTSTIIWYIVIAAVVYYLVYKAYTNYQASGSIFNDEEPLIMNSTSRFAISSRGYTSGSINKDYISGKDCLKMCPSCTWTSNGKCWPPVKFVSARNYNY